LHNELREISTVHAADLRRSEVYPTRRSGASPHVGKGNLEFFNVEGRQDGWEIQVITQPPQSPDLTVNDLGRVENLKDGATTMDELYDSVLQAWDGYDGETLDRIWAHQFECYRQVIRCLEIQWSNSLTITSYLKKPRHPPPTYGKHVKGDGEQWQRRWQSSISNDPENHGIFLPIVQCPEHFSPRFVRDIESKTWATKFCQIPTVAVEINFARWIQSGRAKSN
jgi:hypothetical protein